MSHIQTESESTQRSLLADDLFGWFDLLRGLEPERLWVAAPSQRLDWDFFKPVLRKNF